MLAWLRRKLLIMFMGRDRLELMLASLGIRGVEEVENQGLKATQLARSTLGQTLRQLYDRIPIWGFIILFTLFTLLILIITGVELPRVS